MKSKKDNKLTKGETVTFRISPKIKFGLELLARKQHRTLSSTLEWIISKALQDYNNGLIFNDEDGSQGSLIDEVWDVDEPDRVINLAYIQSNLLTFEEEVVWKTIKETGFFWKGEIKNNKFIWNTLSKNNVVIKRVRENWDKLQKIAVGELSPNTLPNVQELIQDKVKSDLTNAKQEIKNSRPPHYDNDDCPF